MEMQKITGRFEGGPYDGQVAQLPAPEGKPIPIEVTVEGSGEYLGCYRPDDEAVYRWLGLPCEAELD